MPISTVGETARAFVPAPLPPAQALKIDGESGVLLDAASTALGRLDGISLLLPDPAKALVTLENRSVVREITGQQYRKLYSYREYLDVLNEDAI